MREPIRLNADPPLDLYDAVQLADRFKAVAHPARLQLLAHLAGASQPMNVKALTEALGYLTQPTVTHHLLALADAGLVERTKESVYTWYSLDRDAFVELAKTLRPGGRR